jgi:peptide deformylase
VTYPDPALRRKAEPIAVVTDEVRAVAARMFDLMREAKGVGLAAPQVGLSWRMFVVNATGEPGDDHVFINPTLSEPTRTQSGAEEGCLSLPDIRAQIMRPEGITIDAIGLDGERIQQTSDDFPARVWQHEFDHLEGILILDKMDRLDQIANRRQIKRLEESR